jgi:hypothetical protein
MAEFSWRRLLLAHTSVVKSALGMALRAESSPKGQHRSTSARLLVNEADHDTRGKEEIGQAVCLPK